MQISPCDLFALEAALYLEWRVSGSNAYPGGQISAPKDLPRYEFEDAEGEERFKEIMGFGHPFVVRRTGRGRGGEGAGGVDGRAWLSALVDGLEKTGAHAPFAELYPGGLESFSKHVRRLSMMELSDALDAMEEVDEEGKYMHWYMTDANWKFVLSKMLGGGVLEMIELFDRFGGWEDACFGGKELQRKEFFQQLRWFGLYAGTAGVGMFAHKDRHATSSFQVQLAGKKRWRLCNPRTFLSDEAMYSKFKVHADGIARTSNLGGGEN